MTATRNKGRSSSSIAQPAGLTHPKRRERRTKGLQWPWVYIVGLEQGTLPDYRTETEAGLSEERRACFVGVCRAETHLTLTRIEQYRGFRKPPSIFLEEMGTDPYD